MILAYHCAQECYNATEYINIIITKDWPAWQFKWHMKGGIIDMLTWKYRQRIDNRADGSGNTLMDNGLR